jgi:hypothetical protein
MRATPSSSRKLAGSYIATPQAKDGIALISPELIKRPSRKRGAATSLNDSKYSLLQIINGLAEAKRLEALFADAKH